jgi:SAM-dependent methyltransferase
MTVFEGLLEDVASKDDACGDLVTCFEVLEHVQSPDAFCKAMHDVTAPGGVAIMSCLGVDGFDIQLLWEESRSFSPPYHLNFMSRTGMETMLAKAGFDRVEILTPGRLDVEIVQKSMQRGSSPGLSRFEKLLLSRGDETLRAFQQFLADNALSSHVWIIGYRAPA